MVACTFSHIWEPLVALGTLSLAAATYWLGREGRAQIRADWRPVVVVGQRIEGYEMSGGERALRHPSAPPVRLLAELKDEDTFALVLTVRNVGRGPALEVEGSIRVNNGLVRLGSPLHRTIAPGDGMALSWHNVALEEDAKRRVRIVGWIDCTDVSQGGYRTDFAFEVNADGTFEDELFVPQRVGETPPFLPSWIDRLPKRARKRLAQRKLRKLLGSDAVGGYDADEE
jgi:hypothetical protein